MRRLLVFMVVTVATALATAAAGTAGNTVRITGIDLSFPEPFERIDLTGACGFPVYVQGVGELDITLHFDRNGLLVREVYSTPGAFVTYTAPSTGGSYRFGWMPREVFVYPGGATLGGPALYRSTGPIVNHPGQPAEAGIVLLYGTVVAVSPDGVPIVGFGDDPANWFLRGSLTRAEDPTPSICAALAAP